MSPNKAANILCNGLCKRIIPCLDVAGGRTVKGVKFQNMRDVGDPVELAIEYQKQGADELMFLDISATREEKATVFDLIKSVARHLSIPFTVGGGIRNLDDVQRLLECGADKVSVNSAAVDRPELVEEIARACGSQCCVVAIDAKALDTKILATIAPDTEALDAEPHDSNPRGNQIIERGKWEVVVRGGTKHTGIDAFVWARECYNRGAGEILLTSFDTDGTLGGFDLPMVAAFSRTLPIPVIASGGARDPQSFVDVFAQADADAALAASIFHDRLYSVNDVKSTLHQAGIQVRTC
jgi:imidazole glycerol-phosphate synthase subunit HisF